MTTAYLIHNSEGVPVRRIVHTNKGVEAMVVIIDTYDDPGWGNPKYGSAHVNIGKYSEKAERQHHATLRYQLQKQYGYRFEIYWALTSIIS